MMPIILCRLGAFVRISLADIKCNKILKIHLETFILTQNDDICISREIFDFLKNVEK